MRRCVWCWEQKWQTHSRLNRPQLRSGSKQNKTHTHTHLSVDVWTSTEAQYWQDRAVLPSREGISCPWPLYQHWEHCGVPGSDCKEPGVTVDDQLYLAANIAVITWSCIFMLLHIRKILDYCNSLLAGVPACAMPPQQLVQNVAARLIFNLPKFSHTTLLLHTLHWLLVTARIRFKSLLLAYHAEDSGQNHNCLLSGFHNDGTSSLTSGLHLDPWKKTNNTFLSLSILYCF